MEEPVAAAIGAGIDGSQPDGVMVIDIGGGTTDHRYFPRRYCGPYIGKNGGGQVRRRHYQKNICARFISCISVKEPAKRSKTIEHGISPRERT